MMRGWLALPLLLGASQFRDLEAYLTSVDAFVADEQRTFIRRIDEMVANIGDEGPDADDIYSFYEDEHERLHATFPTIVYSSILIVACTLLESAMVDVCKDLERDKRLQKTLLWQEIKEKGIRKAAKFLRVNFGLDPALHPLWPTILDYYKLRDCVAHANGDVSLMKSDQRADVETVAAKYQGLSVTQVARLRIEAAFVRRVLSDYLKFWTDFEFESRDNEDIGPHLWP